MVLWLYIATYSNGPELRWLREGALDDPAPRGMPRLVACV